VELWGKALIIAMLGVFIARWGYALAATRDKPREWQAPRMHTWPLRLNRDAYRVWVVIGVVLTTVLYLIVLALMR
jgi:hypothetical protein